MKNIKNMTLRELRQLKEDVSRELFSRFGFIPTKVNYEVEYEARLQTK